MKENELENQRIVEETKYVGKSRNGRMFYCPVDESHYESYDNTADGLCPNPECKAKLKARFVF